MIGGSPVGCGMAKTHAVQTQTDRQTDVGMRNSNNITTT